MLGIEMYFRLDGVQPDLETLDTRAAQRWNSKLDGDQQRPGGNVAAAGLRWLSQTVSIGTLIARFGRADRQPAASGAIFPSPR